MMQTQSYSVPVEFNKFFDMRLKCTVSSRYTVTIPKAIRKKLSISPGDLVNVGMSDDQQSLLVSKAIEETTDNKVVVNDKNLITIPIELRRYLSIKVGNRLKIFTMNDKFAVLMKTKSI